MYVYYRGRNLLHTSPPVDTRYPGRASVPGIAKPGQPAATFCYISFFSIIFIQGDFFDWSRLKSVGDGKIPTKKVKVRVCHIEHMKI